MTCRDLESYESEAELEAHLASCADCRKAAEENRALGDKIVAALGPLRAPEEDKRAVLARRKIRKFMWIPVASAAAAVLIVASAVFLLPQTQPKKEDLREIAAILDEQQWYRQRLEEKLDELWDRAEKTSGLAGDLAVLEAAALEEHLYAGAGSTTDDLPTLVRKLSSSSRNERADAMRHIRQTRDIQKLRALAAKTEGQPKRYLDAVIRMLDPRPAEKDRVVVHMSSNQNGVKFDLKQYRSGRIVVQTNEGIFEAADIEEFVQKHADLARKYGVQHKSSPIKSRSSIRVQIGNSYMSGGELQNYRASVVAADLADSGADPEEVQQKVQQMFKHSNGLPQYVPDAARIERLKQEIRADARQRVEEIRRQVDEMKQMYRKAHQASLYVREIQK